MAENYECDATSESLKSVKCSSKVIAELELDLKEISSRYHNGNFKGRFALPYAGVIGSNYPIFMYCHACSDSISKSHFSLVIPRARNATAKFNIEITSDQNHSGKIADKDQRPFRIENQTAVVDITLTNFKGKLDKLKGQISFDFEPDESVKMRQILNNKIVKKLCQDLHQPNDFKIVCQSNSEDDTKEKDGNYVEFNRNFLCKISEVFRRMIENPNTKESRDGVIKMIDTPTEILEAFKAAFDVKTINFDKNHISVDLMMFAHKYDIPGLVDFCANYIGNNLEKDTILEVVKAAYFIEDSKLFKKAVAFLLLHLGQFEETPEWNEFKTSHPECFVKITEIMLFGFKFK